MCKIWNSLENLNVCKCVNFVMCERTCNCECLCVIKTINIFIVVINNANDFYYGKFIYEFTDILKSYEQNIFPLLVYFDTSYIYSCAYEIYPNQLKHEMFFQVFNF